MIKAITAVWHTLKDTFTVMGRYGAYSVYPLFAYLVLLVLTFVVVIPILEDVLEPAEKELTTWLFFALVVFLLYGLLYFVMAFANVMLVLGITGQLDGVAPASTGALSTRAVQRVPLLARYTVVAASLSALSILLRVLISPLVGGLIAPLVGDQLWQRWHQLSYKIPLQLAIPIVALDQPPPQNLFQRGGQLVKATWGERVKPAHGMGLLTLLALLFVMLYALPILRQGLVEGNADLRWFGLSVTLIVMLSYLQLSALVNAIFGLAAYRYATAGKRDLFPGDPSYAERAFVTTQKAAEPRTALSTAQSDAPH